MGKDTLKLDLVAIIKDDTVYIKEKENYSSKLSQYKLRFDAIEKESFKKDWKVFKTVPTMAEYFVTGQKILMKYKLKDGFTPTDKTPEFMTKDDFKCCNDTCENSEIVRLYESVYREEHDQWKIVDMTLEVIDSNCEPLFETKYKYVVEFPRYIDRHMIVHHTMPCYIEGDDAYDYIRTATKKNLPSHCKITSDYDFHFVVEASVPYLEDPLIDEKKIVISISKIKYNYGGPVQDVHADNYYKLEAKMDGIIQKHLDRMNTKIRVCPKCRGKGWIEDE